MTKIDIRDFCVSIQGHANAKRNAENHDLVCAAVSALACTLAEMVAREAEAGAFVQEPVICMAPGNVYIACTPKKKRRVAIENHFAFFACGVLQIAAKYPENVQVKKYTNGG